MQSQRKLVHSSLMPIRWGDMDAYGHVNNTVYFRYMEQCRVEYLEELGYTIMPRGTAPVIINAACTFLVPLNYPGVVEVRMYCGQPGRSSVPTHYEIRLTGDETIYATGDAKIVWMDVASGKSVPIPDALRAQLTE
jgi:acyl-CoA thioester hydrolase